jgi:hypothetical protein
MESQGKGDNFEAQGEGSGTVTWNSVVSSFMLNHLAEMVANGTRTSSGLKNVHLNMCSRLSMIISRPSIVEKMLKTI